MREVGFEDPTVRAGPLLGFTGWQNQSAVLRIARNVEIGLCFNLDGLRIQGAWW